MMVLTRSILIFAATALVVLANGPLQARALVGTADDGNLGIFLPNPSQGLPTPPLSVIAGFPAGARPHGSAIVDVNLGLMADFQGNRIFVVSLDPAQVVATLATPSYRGLGTLAVSPDRSVALASGFDPAVTVIRAPFAADSAQNDIPLPAAIAGFATQNIAFDAQGRAYVRHTEGISVIDPPYQAVAFTLPIDSTFAGGIAVSPDGAQLITGYVVPDDGGDDIPDSAGHEPLPPSTLAPLAEGLREDIGGLPRSGIDVASLPLDAASTLQRIELLRCNCFAAGVAITPDGEHALLAMLLLQFGEEGDPVVFSLPAPFSDATALETLPLPPGFPIARGFEDIGISADGSEAMLVGQSASGNPNMSGLPALYIRAPFTAADAQLSVLNLPGGRGAGSVRYAPLGTLPPPPAPPAPTLPVPVGGGIGLLLMLLALLGLAGRPLTRAGKRA